LRDRAAVAKCPKREHDRRVDLGRTKRVIPVTASPREDVYRSREHALRTRIRALEEELAALRRDLHGLPEVKKRKLHAVARALMALLVLAAAIAMFVLVERSHDNVVVVPTFSSAGWTMSVRFPKSARCLGVSVDHPDGSLEHVDCTTSLAPDLASFGLTFEQAREPVTLDITYDAGGGARRAAVRFDPAEAKTREVSRLITMVPQWVAVEAPTGHRFLYFSTLLSYSFALREIRYGFDDEAPVHRLRFAPRDRPGITDGDEVYISFPDAARTVSVEVVFADGTTSRRSFPLTTAQ
jgi:hypothetical protein